VRLILRIKCLPGTLIWKSETQRSVNVVFFSSRASFKIHDWKLWLCRNNFIDLVSTTMTILNTCYLYNYMKCLLGGIHYHMVLNISSKGVKGS